MKPKVYLAGQWNRYQNNWKDILKSNTDFDFYDPEIDSDQSGPDIFYRQDLSAVKNSDILIAHPGTAPSEATWIEIGYFISLHTSAPGDFCPELIIIWPPHRLRWSLEFVKKTGVIVGSVAEAKKYLLTLN